MTTTNDHTPPMPALRTPCPPRASGVPDQAFRGGDEPRRPRADPGGLGTSWWRRYAVTVHPGMTPWYAALAAAPVALNNLAAERHAHELARPAWRAPRHSPVVLTSHRLLWREQSGWPPLDATLITAHRRHGHILDIEWLNHDPVRFHGPRVPELDVYLTWLLHGQHGLAAMPLP